MIEIHGYCDEKFASVQERFVKNYAEYGDVGACRALTVEGGSMIVIDLDAHLSIPMS